MPGSGILFCDERAKERDETSLAGMPTRRLLSRRRALAARLGGAEQVLSGSLTEQTRRCGKAGCRCAGGEPHGPYAFFAPKTAARGRLRYVPASLAGVVRRYLRNGRGDRAAARGDLGDQRRAAGPARTVLAGERRRPVRARAGRGGGGAGQHDGRGTAVRGGRLR